MALPYPALKSNTDASPTSDESSVEYFPLGPVDCSSFPYFYLPVIADITDDFDNFFSSLVYGKDGLPASKLKDKFLDQKVSDAIQHLHKVIRAQVLNSDLRAPALKELQAELLDGTAVNPNRLRLVQNATSTRILQTFLAAMLIPVTIAAFLTDPRGVLPKNP